MCEGLEEVGARQGVWGASRVEDWEALALEKLTVMENGRNSSSGQQGGASVGANGLPRAPLWQYSTLTKHLRVSKVPSQT